MAKKKRKARIWSLMHFIRAKKLVKAGKGRWEYWGRRRLLVMADNKHIYIVTR